MTYSGRVTHCQSQDYRQMGVGGDDSWSPRVHREFQLTNHAYRYGYTIQVTE